MTSDSRPPMGIDPGKNRYTPVIDLFHNFSPDLTIDVIGKIRQNPMHKTQCASERLHHQLELLSTTRTNNINPK